MTMFYELQSDAVRITRREHTPEGYLRLWGVSALEGTMEYPQRRETQLVPADTLVQSDAAWPMMPITVEHPPEKDGVHAGNWRQYAVGVVEHAETEEGKRKVRLLITDRGAIKAAEKKKWLSEAYTPVLVSEDGEFNGVRYNVKQTKREPNHMALTDNPRAGKQAMLFDSADDVPETPAWAAQMIALLTTVAAQTKPADPPATPAAPAAPPAAPKQADSNVEAIVAARVMAAQEGVQVDSADLATVQRAILAKRGVQVDSAWSVETLGALLSTTKPTAQAKPPAQPWGAAPPKAQQADSAANQTQAVPAVGLAAFAASFRGDK